jgi:hypothetical protein
LGVQIKFEQEVARYNKFRKNVLGTQEKSEAENIDLKTYAKYLLKEGSVVEKRELLSSLKTRLIIRNKQIVLQEK